MSQLTKTAQKTFIGLALGNLLIIFALTQLSQYYYAGNNSFIAANTVRALTRLVNQLQTTPETNWPTILQNRNNLRSAEITLTQTPVYSQNALLTLQAPVIFDLMKQNKKLEFSVFVRENSWLNISMMWFN